MRELLFSITRKDLKIEFFSGTGAGEDLSDVSVAAVDMPTLGGMIARNPKDHKDQWYVAGKYFRENLIPA